MPDMTPLGASANTPAQNLEPINTILGIKRQQLGLQQQTQQLQTGEYARETAAAGAQGAQRTQSELQRLSAIPWHSYENADGSLDVDKATKAALSVAPTEGPAFVKRLTDMSQGAAQTKSAWESLSQERQAPVRATVAAWAASNGSRKDLTDQTNLLLQNAPDSARPAIQKVVDHTLQTIDGPDLVSGAPKSVAQQKQTALTFARSGLSQEQLSGTGGLGTKAPATLSTGTTQLYGTTNRATGETQFPGQAPNAPQELHPPPGYQMINGQLVRVSDTGLSVPQAPGAAAPQTPPNKLQPTPRPDVNPGPGMQERYNAQMADNLKHVQGVSAAANDISGGVGATQYRNTQLKDMLQKEIANNKPNITGPGSDILHSVVSHTPGMTKYANDYDTINHYLAQNSAALAHTMGVQPTDAGAAQAAAAAGSTKQTPGALLEVTKVNDALNTGLDYYNRGLAKATNNGADMSKVSAFRQAFGQNFDVNAMRYEDAKREGNADEMTRIVKANGGQAFAQKLKTLRALANTGDLP